VTVRYPHLCAEIDSMSRWYASRGCMAACVTGLCFFVVAAMLAQGMYAFSGLPLVIGATQVAEVRYCRRRVRELAAQKERLWDEWESAA
jgi:hypothetical protein